MQAEQLHGMAVVSVQQAERIGRIEDVAIDLREHRLAALLLQGGLFRGGPVVPWERVRAIGQDAVTVDDRSATAEGRPETGGAKLGDLRGTKVVTDAGTFVGTLAGAEIDPDSGRVTSYSITAPHGGGLFHAAPQFTLPATAVVAIGPDLITVQASALRPSNGDAQAARGGNATR
jgi:sporulation protein YlmC with PRC-barrel domain